MPKLHPVSPHKFHIPVMGTGFTIDTPLRVARYGISSVISLVDDVLMEQMRQYYCGRNDEEYIPITDSDPDPRANRITAYLNYLDNAVQRQIESLRKESFEPDSGITQYFEMLPQSPLRDSYAAMLDAADPSQKTRMQTELRRLVVPGDIDVNIMTKLDRARYENGVRLPAEFSDAKAALRGFARSTLRSSVVLSAGMNRDLYKYMRTFGDFLPVDGHPAKKITLKVSDYRSAEVQGAFFAKLGLWVSEYRIESGLNCGGHAFATKGYLLGPILEEFRENRARLTERLRTIYRQAFSLNGNTAVGEPADFRITVQGGIGTAGEHEFLMNHYGIEGTGWGTPFLMVPEAVNLDSEHHEKLIAATSDDVWLSDSSPLGVPFWNLRTSASEELRRRHISAGRPGSPCIKGYLKLDTSITDTPACRASLEYQRKRLSMLESEPMTPDQRIAATDSILVKSCICHDLAGSVTKLLGIDQSATTAVCCGPNILNFKKLATLREMVDHIYGRLSLLTNPDRQHMFANELKIYVDYFRREVDNHTADLSNRTQEYLIEFRSNLLDGIDYYLNMAEQFIDGRKARFLRDIHALREELEQIALVPA